MIAYYTKEIINSIYLKDNISPDIASNTIALQAEFTYNRRTKKEIMIIKTRMTNHLGNRGEDVLLPQ